jgi:hypothetical protein
MLAIALQALWPLVAQAKPQSSTLVPICTVDGVTHYLELRKGDTPLEKSSAAQHEHCGFCLFGGAALLPSVPHIFDGNSPVDAEPAQAVTPSLASRWFPPARPRAPPASS